MKKTQILAAIVGVIILAMVIVLAVVSERGSAPPPGGGGAASSTSAALVETPITSKSFAGTRLCPLTAKTTGLGSASPAAPTAAYQKDIEVIGNALEHKSCNLCLQIQSQGLVVQCVGNVITAAAISARDAGRCDEILDSRLLASCKDGVAISKAQFLKDPSLCASVGDARARENCKAAAKMGAPPAGRPAPSGTASTP